MKNIKSIMAFAFAIAFSLQSIYGMENSLKKVTSGQALKVAFDTAEALKNAGNKCFTNKTLTIISGIYVVAQFFPIEYRKNLAKMLTSKTGAALVPYGSNIGLPWNDKIANILKSKTVRLTVCLLKNPLYYSALLACSGGLIYQVFFAKDETKEIKKELELLRTQILNVNKNILIVDKKVDQANNSITDIKEDTKNIKTNIVKISEKQNDQSVKINNIGEDTKSIKTNLVKIGEKQNEHTKEFESIKKEQSALQELIGKGNTLIEQVKKGAITKEELKQAEENLINEITSKTTLTIDELKKELPKKEDLTVLVTKEDLKEENNNIIKVLLNIQTKGDETNTIVKQIKNDTGKLENIVNILEKTSERHTKQIKGLYDLNVKVLHCSIYDNEEKNKQLDNPEFFA